jgi:hypothetical protein
VTGAAPLASPSLTGTPTAPTATAGTNTTQLATTAYVQTAVAATANTSAISTYAAQANLGTGGTVACFGSGYTCTAQRGRLVFTSGTASIFSGLQAIITFSTAYSSAPTCFVLQYTGGTSYQPYWTSTATTLSISLSSGLASAGNVKEFDYYCTP